MIEILLVFILVALIVSIFLLVYLLLKIREVRLKDVETSVSNAVSTTWIKLGLGDKISAVENHARDIRDSYKSFEQMLRVPTERGAFGELSLETIISDQLPPNMYGIRKKVLDGKIPDAHIRSPVGLICIDSKFPLDNYRNMLNAENPKEKDDFRKKFIKNFRNQLDKIADDYVCPQEGSAEFAFAYICSEGVYHFLVKEAFEILRDYTKKGIQVVSPLTLSHKIELIRAGVLAKKLSEEAEKVRKDLDTLTHEFDEIDVIWQVLQTHVKNLESKAGQLDEAYKKLRDKFDNISKFSEEED